MKTAYFNCKSGIAGDMILAALIDAGVSSRLLETSLKKYLKLKDWKLKVKSAGALYHIPVKQVQVVGEKHFSSPAAMKRLINQSKLPSPVKKKSIEIMDCLINAEAKAHKVHPKNAHFHELNSLDTIIDVTGSCLALEMLKIEKICSSPVNIGCPAPASLEIVKQHQIPVYSTNSKVELATPTGLAIISCISNEFCEMPLMKLNRTGLGAGTKKIDDNILRVLIGSTIEAYYDQDEVVVLETNIDDMDPRVYPYVMEKLLKAGVKDVWISQVLMKKGRPGVVLSVICDEKEEKSAIDIIFSETTTLGIRRKTISRHILNRKTSPKQKTAYILNGKSKTKSEYEPIRKKALKSSTPLYKILI